MQGPSLPISQEIHAEKYRGKGESFREAMGRVANALKDDEKHYQAFRDILLDMRFLPAGRVQSAMGSTKHVTSSNCYLSAVIDDSFVDGNSSIMARALEAAATMRQGGGIGYDFCLTPGTKVLKNDLSWVDVETLVEGDRLIAFPEQLDLQKKMLEVSIVESNKSLTQPCVSVSTDRGTISCSETHKFVVRRVQDYPHKRKGTGYKWVDAVDLKEGDQIAFALEPWGEEKIDPVEAGWLSGFFDGEGWVCKPDAENHAGKSHLGMGQNPGAALDKCLGLLAKYRFPTKLTNSSTNLVSRPLIQCRIQGKWQAMRFLSLFKPCRLYPKHRFLWEGAKLSTRTNKPATVSRVERIGNQLVWATKTSTKTLIANGFLTHNSNLRPRGDVIKKLESHSSGPVSFMEIFDAVCRCVASSGHRRGAQMGVLRVDHPSIEEFIRAKQPSDEMQILWNLASKITDATERSATFAALQSTFKLTGFNISVAVTDRFMECLKTGEGFDLKFGNQVYQTVDASALWDMIMRSTWDYAEPGVLFVDTMNKMNNLYYAEKIAATNPCLAAGTLVHTPHGLRAIEYLKVGDSITTVYGTAPITSVEVHRDQPVFLVVLRNGRTVRATAAHIFHQYLPDIDVFECDTRLDHLREGALIRTTDGVSELVSVTPDGIEDVYDLYESKSDTFIANGIVHRGCGEQPLPPSGCCLLGSFNLVKYITGTKGSYSFDAAQFIQDIPTVVRAMDNVVDRSRYPLYEQEKEQKNKRRMGLGVTGLANALEALGLPYGSPGFIAKQDEILSLLKNQCYLASAVLSSQKGSFPLYVEGKYLKSKFIKTLDPEVRSAIKKHGIRNSHLTSIAPTGTISLCADNVSSGIEPVFSYSYDRAMRTATGDRVETVTDYGVRVFGVHGKRTSDVTIDEHLAVLLTAAKQCDSAVSKTCNVPGTVQWDEFKNLYVRAYEGGAKGCTTFRIDGKRSGILSSKDTDSEETSCTIMPDGSKSCE